METQHLESNCHDLFNIEIGNFLSYIKNGISLDQIYILQLYEKGEDITIHISSSKVEGWRVNLVRKGYLEKDNKVTELGKSLLSGDNIGEVIKINKKELKKAVEGIKSDFDRWWDTFPATDKIPEANMQTTRPLRTDRDKCKELFCNMVDKGEFTADQIINGTACDVANRRKLSIKTGKNGLTFLQNSATYLRQKTFEPLIEEKVTLIKSQSKTISI